MSVIAQPLSAFTGGAPQPQAGSVSTRSTGPSKYRGAVVEDLQLPPAFALSQSERVERAVELAYDRDFSFIPVLGAHRKPVGYIDVASLKSKWEAGTANPSGTLGTFMTKFKRGTGVAYTVITPETSLEELEVFLEKNNFAIVTDGDRKFVLGLATKDDLTGVPVENAALGSMRTELTTTTTCHDQSSPSSVAPPPSTLAHLATHKAEIAATKPPIALKKMSSFAPAEHFVGERAMMMPAPPSPPVSPGVRNPTSTILVPVFSPPTPAPSPRPLSPTTAPKHHHYPLSFNRDVLPSFVHLSASQRREFITQLLAACDVDQLVHANALIQPRLKRDFLRELPLEVSLLVLSFVDDARTLARAAQVSKFWQALLADDAAWKRMCEEVGYGASKSATSVPRSVDDLRRTMRRLSLTSSPSVAPQSVHQRFFKDRHLTERNWARGGRILDTHTLPDDGVITSVAMDDEWIVVGLANQQIHVLSTQTGRMVRTLLGHTLGVWTLGLVSKGGARRGSGDAEADAQVTPGALRGFGRDDAKRAMSSDVCNASAGWGQSGAIVVSGGCDRDVRVWDLTTGACLHTLQGHTSTIRCLKVLDNRPVAVSGSRDTTVRVWDIARGRVTNVLQGHTDSVRCLEVSGNLVVSGSYDTTCRLWNVDTGECLKVFRGHYHEVYSVAFDGNLVVTGSLDSQVRIWSPATGECIALHQGHTSLVGQIQLLGNTLVTGGSDGRVIVYNTSSLDTNHRLSAHDNSVTCLQFDQRYVVSGGSDGYVKMYDMKTGQFVREMTSPCEAVWRVCFREDRCVVMCRRSGRTVIEIWTFRPTDEELGV